MLIKRTTHGSGGPWLGLGILLVGAAIGFIFGSGWEVGTDPAPGDTSHGSVLPGAAPSELRNPRVAPTLSRLLQRNPDPEPVADNGLETIELDIPPASAAILQSVRDRAMNRGVIVQSEEDTVPARLLHAGGAVDAEIRIKGDWTDHVKTEKWSYRIKMSGGKYRGMRVFSIQAPSTRGYMWEWLALALGRREGLLAPRCDFVNVVINGNVAGVHYLEEHFSKELLESQGRREGPIVSWDESTSWATIMQANAGGKDHESLVFPESNKLALRMGSAAIRAYGEKRLSSIESLSRSLHGAVEKMRKLQRLLLGAEGVTDRLRLMLAMDEVTEDSIDGLIDIDRLACFHALASLLQIWHGLAWQNLRFYHNTVTDRLEPIMFDTNPHILSTRNPVPLRDKELASPLAKSAAYYNRTFEYIGRFSEPAFLEDFFKEVESDALRFESALMAEEPLATSFRWVAMKQRLRAQQGHLRTVAFPVDPVNFAASYEPSEDAERPFSGFLDVRAWSTSYSPVLLEGFRFGNGNFVSAAGQLVATQMRVAIDPRGGVTLPRNGVSAHFRIPMDKRLSMLESVQAVKRIVRTAGEDSAGPDNVSFDLEVVYRLRAASASVSEPLLFRRSDAAWVREGGRPAAPTLEEALTRYPFLEYLPEKGQLVIRAGLHVLSGDLLIPSGVHLRIEAGATLRFPGTALLLTDAPLFFEGTAAEPVVLEPVAGAEHWSGIVVLQSAGRSRWVHTQVRNTDAVARGGWVVTGGITFYQSPVTMVDCEIAGSAAEDGLNIFAADFELERVTLRGCVSDSFDGDFVSGRLTDCLFTEGLADGVDFSGSRVQLDNCRFVDLADKAISSGENTELTVHGGVVDGVSIGIAAKDSSTVRATGVRILNASNYALAAFIKKAEFGPSTLIGEDLEIVGSGRGDALAQTGCVLTWNGKTVATQDLDVPQLYRDKILGQ